MKNKKTILILTGGGLAQALNATLYGAITKAKKEGYKILGGLNGWASLIEDHKIIDLTGLDIESIKERGGTFLMSSRTNPFKLENGPALIADKIKKHDIDCLLAIGGDDTLGTAAKLYKEYDIPVIGLPKTIDNDLPATYFSPGFPSAAYYAAKLAAETKEDSAYALNRVFILEMYGARAGWLAGATALGNTDIIIPPEWEFSSDKILSLIKEKYETNGRNCVVAIAHEAKISGIKGKAHQQPDGYQHDRHEFNGIALRDAVINKLNISSQIIMPMNYVQSGEPIELDKTMGRSLGEFAVEMINNEKFGQGGAVDYQGGEFKIKAIDLNDFSGDVKRLTEDMFDKEKMLPTEKYLNYLKTLIGNFDFINRDYLKLQQYILNGHYKKNFK